MPLMRRLCDRDSRVLIHDKLLLHENSPIVLFLPGYKELPLVAHDINSQSPRNLMS